MCIGVYPLSHTVGTGTLCIGATPLCLLYIQCTLWTRPHHGAVAVVNAAQLHCTVTCTATCPYTHTRTESAARAARATPRRALAAEPWRVSAGGLCYAVHSKLCYI